MDTARPVFGCGGRGWRGDPPQLSAGGVPGGGRGGRSFYLGGWGVRQVLGWEHRSGAAGVTAAGTPVSRPRSQSRLSARHRALALPGGAGGAGTRSAAPGYAATFLRAEAAVLPASRGRAARLGAGRRRPCRYRAGGGGGAGRPYGAGGGGGCGAAVRRPRDREGWGGPAARPRGSGEVPGVTPVAVPAGGGPEAGRAGGGAGAGEVRQPRPLALPR